MSLIIVIPARMASTRFPGKPLADLNGKPMLKWVHEASVAAEVADKVLIATPDQEILEACRRMGLEAVETRLDHPSGTDRLAEVAAVHVADAYLNVQGDEPLIADDSIRACADILTSTKGAQMSSVYCDCPEEEVDNPNVVKVVTDLAGRALYFSRCPVPYARNPRIGPAKKHIGIYGYRRDVLLDFPKWGQGDLEKAESLEQLRFLENGVDIHMALGAEGGPAVDTPEQAEEVRRILNATSRT